MAVEVQPTFQLDDKVFLIGGLRPTVPDHFGLEQHGGSIDVVSAVGQGTTVTVRLPLEAAEPGAFCILTHP